MPRDAEQRLIAYVTLLVTGVAAVGWYAWFLTAARPPGAVSLFVLGSTAAVVLSISAGPIAVLLGDRPAGDWATTARHVTLLLVLGILAATGYVLFVAVDGAITVAATALALVAFWGVVPLAIGAVSATTGGTSMGSVLVAWPATNLLGLAAFLAPTPGGGIDFGRSNATVLDEPARTVVLLAVAVVATFGPTLVGKVIDRYVYRGSIDAD